MKEITIRMKSFSGRAQEGRALHYLDCGALFWIKEYMRFITYEM